MFVWKQTGIELRAHYSSDCQIVNYAAAYKLLKHQFKPKRHAELLHTVEYILETDCTVHSGSHTACMSVTTAVIKPFAYLQCYVVDFRSIFWKWGHCETGNSSHRELTVLDRQQNVSKSPNPRACWLFEAQMWLPIRKVVWWPLWGLFLTFHVYFGACDVLWFLLLGNVSSEVSHL